VAKTTSNVLKQLSKYRPFKRWRHNFNRKPTGSCFCACAVIKRPYITENIVKSPLPLPQFASLSLRTIVISWFWTGNQKCASAYSKIMLCRMRKMLITTANGDRRFGGNGSGRDWRTGIQAIVTSRPQPISGKLVCEKYVRATWLVDGGSSQPHWCTFAIDDCAVPMQCAYAGELKVIKIS